MKEYEIKVTSIATVYVEAESETEALDKVYEIAPCTAADFNDAVIIDVIDLDD